ncbi:D-alanine--D-alanine ligase family protein [Gleimia hominis]|uniref:D-alanine--D-alanine ligase family protein n=1 Tax=Gleimia hominis TaxID=595468 RepID=UPI000C8071EC|nr:D-alanine--D-alanine ligase [Gleimia hominis]WIK64172.1 D-alanine--D-alanine ligase [Gleimia hominis]
MTLRILIVAGGLTHERDVSLRSGRRVATLLRREGHAVKVCDLNAQLFTTLSEFDPDLVWPMIHGSVGEDGSLQDLLYLLGYPYVGSTPDACVLASSKPSAKALVSQYGVLTPASVSLSQSLFRQVGAEGIIRAIDDSFRFPVMVKPADGGSALGISLATSEDQLRAALVDAFSYGDAVMVEDFVEGREVAVSVLDVTDTARALPPVEIVAEDGRYDYDARYNPGRSRFFVPARLSDDEADSVKDVAVRVHEALGMRHLSRIDLIVDHEGAPWFIDANVVPGMTDTSLFPQAAQADSSFTQILNQLAYTAVDDTDGAEEGTDPADLENTKE